MREKQVEWNKENEKEFQRLVKKTAKKAGYNVISRILYKKTGGYFVLSNYFPTRIEDKLMVMLDIFVKTYESDNLFWEIFNMADNINYRDSLRANGAFAMPSMRISKHIINFIELEETNQKMVQLILKEHNDFIEKVGTTEEFNEYILRTGDYNDEKLIKMIANIELNNYRDAKDMAYKEISLGNRGGYINCEKDIYQYIYEYCEKM